MVGITKDNLIRFSLFIYKNYIFLAKLCSIPTVFIDNTVANNNGSYILYEKG